MNDYRCPECSKLLWNDQDDYWYCDKCRDDYKISTRYERVVKNE